MEKLSVFLITLNEEKNIGRCLESIKWADEIIVVDGFSTDKTVQIAKKYRCKVYSKDFIGFGPLKNFALSKTRNNWVLNMDADEVLPPELSEEIRNVIKNPQYAGYYFARRSYIGKRWVKHAGQYPSYQLRLFRKDKGKFEDVQFHERAIIDGTVGYMKNDITHYNFEDWPSYVQDMNRTSSLEARALLTKKFVWFYPLSVVSKFFSEIFRYMKKGNNLYISLRIAKNSLADYEIKPLIPFRPLITFIRLYIIQLGFLDGAYGLFWCLFVSFSKFVKYAKYYELRHGLNGCE